MKVYHLKAPVEKIPANIKAGDLVLISGTLITARDAAHKRMADAISRGEKLPVELRGQVIYYVGPAPAPYGMPIGSAGPTTSGRMDKYAPILYRLGVKATMGKGRRSKEVKDAIKETGSLYLVTFGGAGAYLAKRVRSAKVIAYGDLGPEAIYALEVEDFPAIVGIDPEGNDIFGRYY